MESLANYWKTYLLLFFLAACSGPDRDAGADLDFQPIQHDFGPSGMPNLSVTNDGTAYLSWIEFADDTTDVLRFARWEGDKWAGARTIASGANWFVNWADFPALASLPGQEDALVAHWLQMSAAGTYDYDVRMALSRDGGAAWDSSFVLHKDGVAAEHGFVSLEPTADGRIFAAWLDGRLTKSDGPMTLRGAYLDADGQVSEEMLLDEKVCDCCQTAAVQTSAGMLVAYRDRSDLEVRDIAVVRRTAQGWTAPQLVHADNWQISGCPVNGPALAADGARVALAWFTGVGGNGAVNVAFSEDGGDSWSRPIRVDEGKPLGRVDVVSATDGEALVVWLEENGQWADIRLRRVKPGREKPAPAQTIATTSQARDSGFPRLVNTGEELLLAYTTVDSTGTRVETLVAKW